MRRLLILCCVVVLVDTVFFAALAPLMPYYKQTFGLSRFAVGILNSAYGAGMIAGAAPAVGLTARYGVRPAAWVGLVILALTSVMFGLADNMASLIAFRFGSGFGSTCSWIAIFTWITSVGSSERRGQLIGTLISAAVVGGLFGPLLGSAAAKLGTIPVFSLIACLGLMAAAGLSFEPPPARVQRSSGAALVMLARLRPATGLSLIALSSLLFSTLVVLAPLNLAHLGWGAMNIGVVFFLGAVFEAMLHPIAGYWSDKFGYRTPVVVSLGLSAILLIALPLAGNAWLLAVIVAVAAGIFNMALTPGVALFTHNLDQLGDDQALGFALTDVAWAGGFTIGAPLAGWLSDLGGNSLTCTLLAAICCLLLLVIRWLI